MHCMPPTPFDTDDQLLWCVCTVNKSQFALVSEFLTRSVINNLFNKHI